MHSERDGKIITKVSFTKKGIIITFNDETKWNLSESTYSHFYLYKDKIISQEEIDEINFYESIAKGKDYAISLLTSGIYSKKEIENKLYTKKKLNKKEVEYIINELIELNMINDGNYVSEYIELYERKNYGKNRILNEFYQAGISKDIINNIIFDEDNELFKAKDEVTRFIKSNPNKNYNKLCASCYNHLMLYGFSNDIASKAIEIIEEEYDKDKETMLLERSLIRYIETHNVDLSNYESKKKLVDSFLRKGYRYEDIESVLRRIKNEIR